MHVAVEDFAILILLPSLPPRAENMASLDKDREAWLKAIRDDRLSWPNHVSDLNGWTSSGGKTYGIRSVPSTVLVDREGKVVARNLRGSDLERKLEQLLEQ